MVLYRDRLDIQTASDKSLRVPGGQHGNRQPTGIGNARTDRMNILLEAATSTATGESSMKPRRLGQRLLKLATIPVAISILFSVACGDDSPTPTPRPDPAQVEMQRTLEELGEAVTALNAQVKKLQDPDEEPEKLLAKTTEATEPPAVEQTIEQPTPQPSPQPVAQATYDGPGICERTPTVQEVILLTLRIPSCGMVTERELFRITLFRTGRDSGWTGWNWPKEGPAAGDFAGLVNLQGGLTIEGDFTIPAGTFTDLSLEKMILQVDGIQPGAFDGASVQQMGLEIRTPLRKGALPTSLETLSMRIITTASPAIKSDALEGLVNLEWLIIRLHERPERRISESTESHHLPPGVLKNSTALKGLSIGTAEHGYGSTPAKLYVQKDLTANLSYLEVLRLENLYVNHRGQDAPPLELHQDAPLRHYLEEPIRESDYSRSEDQQEWWQWTDGKGISFYADHELYEWGLHLEE